MRFINSISNVAYGIAAFATLFDPFLSASLVVLMLGSGWYHWSRGKWSQRADHFGMFLVLCALAMPGVPLWGYGVVTAVCALVAFRGACSATDVVTILGAVVIAVQPSLERAALGLILFGIAYFYWNQEPHDAWWAEEGKPFHTIWHVLTAMAFIVLA